MKFPLPSAPMRGAVLLFSCVLALLLGYLGLRNAFAAHDLELDTRRGYERAVGLEPANSRNWYLLGRSYLYDFEQPDSGRAIEALRKAVALDPYSAEALLDLATAYEGEGDAARARETFLAAQRAYPLSPDVSWSYGNFLLRQGEQDLAFREIRKAVELEPRRAAEAFSRALRVQPDANVLLDQAVPPATAAYLPILHSLSPAGDVVNAQLVWNRLVALHQPVPMSELVHFIGELIRETRIADATRAWTQAVSIMQHPPPPDPAGSLVWDGGFESGYSGGGFSWQFLRETEDVQIAFDRSEKHSGEQSLRILFKGRRNLDYEGVCHYIAPEPGTAYLLSGWVRTQALTSSQGVRLQIFVYTSNKKQSVVSEEVHGTEPWKQIQLPWVSPPDGMFGSVCVRRLMSDMPESDIQGAAWIDDISMLPVDEASPEP